VEIEFLQACIPRRFGRLRPMPNHLCAVLKAWHVAPLISRISIHLTVLRRSTG
jgi:hypothetical protein